MRRLLNLLFVTTFLCSALAFAEETFTVSGEVKFPKRKGEIYVWLKTQEEFRKQEKPASPARSLMIKPSPQQLKAKKVAFKFVDVPKGIYCIVCIQDLNNNGKIDFAKSRGLVPLEPLGFSGTSFPVQWDGIKFLVDKDISAIKIRLSG